MAYYCDTTQLEEHWLRWIVAKGVPELEIFRKRGILGTQLVGRVCTGNTVLLLEQGQSLGDPSFPIRAHVVMFNQVPILINSYNGRVQRFGIDSKGGYVELARIRTSVESRTYDSTKDASLCQEYCDKLAYYVEPETEKSWQELLLATDRICTGIAVRFRQKSEEELRELSSEALIQVMNKLKTGKLSYKPGKAPVFNLLTTTIYRCMFTIMNKRTSHREHQQQLIQAANNKVLPEFHSFKAQHV